MQNCGMAPPFVTYAQGLSTETVGDDFFWPKTGLNLSEDLFFVFFCFFGHHLILGQKPDKLWVKTLLFWSSPNFGQENGFWSSLFSNFLNFLPPPPPFSKILRTLLDARNLVTLSVIALIGEEIANLKWKFNFHSNLRLASSNKWPKCSAQKYL